MNITVDQDTCVGAGQCVLAAPDVFDQRDEDGIAYPLSADTDEQHRAAADEAAQLCPAAAIHIQP